MAVLEVTVVRPVEEGANHNTTGDQYAAELASGTSEEWTEVGRRVKSVQIRPA